MIEHCLLLSRHPFAWSPLLWSCGSSTSTSRGASPRRRPVNRYLEQRSEHDWDSHFALKGASALTSLPASLKVLDISLCMPPKTRGNWEDASTNQHDLIGNHSHLIGSVLSQQVAKFTSLQALDLSGWHLAKFASAKFAPAALPLLQGLATLPALRELELARCELLQDNAAGVLAALCTLAQRPRLALLDIRGTTLRLPARTQLLDALAARERRQREPQQLLIPSEGGDGFRRLELRFDGAPALHTAWVRSEFCTLMDAAAAIRASVGEISSQNAQSFVSRLRAAYADACKAQFAARPPGKAFCCPASACGSILVKSDGSLAERPRSLPGDVQFMVATGDVQFMPGGSTIYFMSSRRVVMKCSGCRSYCCLPLHLSDLPASVDKDAIKPLWPEDLSLPPDSTIRFHRQLKDSSSCAGDQSWSTTHMWLEVLLNDAGAWMWG